MNYENIYLKRGATLRTRLSLGFDHSDFTFTAQAKVRGVRVDLDVRQIEPRLGGIIEVSASASVTADWPQGVVRFDVRGAVGAEIAFTETYNVIVASEVTA